MKTIPSTAMLLALCLAPVTRADAVLVSFSTATGGGIDEFSLTPEASGTVFDAENTAVNSVTIANNTAYWSTGSQIFSDSLTDSAYGANKTALPSIPFAGVSITDLAVDPATNSYFVGWNAPGYGWFIAEYPLSPSGNYSIFKDGTAPIQGLTVSGDTAYWIEGTKIYSQKLDGSGLTQLQNFDPGVSLFDLAVDPAAHTYFLGAAAPPVSILGEYPLTPNASGNVFAFANDNITALTIAGDRAYWIDGQSVWSENLNGQNLTLQEMLPQQFTPTDLAVSLDTPAAAPEPATVVVVIGGFIVIALVKRRLKRTSAVLPATNA